MECRIARFPTGPLETNSYVVASSGADGVIVDPSAGCDDLREYLQQQSLSIRAILLTHGHFDHCMGVPELISALGEIPVYIHPAERGALADPQMNGSPMIGIPFSWKGPVHDLTEGPISFGALSLEVRFVPGHSPGGTAFVCGRECLCGDALFAGSIGRTDLPGGDYATLLEHIRTRLLTLPDDTTLYPGHGNRTTVAREKRLNPFLQ